MLYDILRHKSQYFKHINDIVDRTLNVLSEILWPYPAGHLKHCGYVKYWRWRVLYQYYSRKFSEGAWPTVAAASNLWDSPKKVGGVWAEIRVLKRNNGGSYKLGFNMAKIKREEPPASIL